MNVSLTPELEQMVQQKVTSGSYSSASEVVREALRLMQERDEVRRIRLEELRREINLGVEAADRGELVDAEQFFDAMEAELEQQIKATQVP